MTLVEACRDDALRARVVAHAERILEDEVASKRGLQGAAIKTSFAAVKRMVPDFVPSALDKLAPHFAPVLDRYWEPARASGDPKAYFRRHDGEIADGLLGVTDGLAARAQNRALLKVYRSLRGQARGHVTAGVPRIADLITAYEAELRR